MKVRLVNALDLTLEEIEGDPVDVLWTVTSKWWPTLSTGDKIVVIEAAE